MRDLGIEYDFDGYVKTLPSKQKKDQEEEAKARQAAKKLEDQVKKDSRPFTTGNGKGKGIVDAKKQKQSQREPRQKRAKKVRV